MAHHGIWRDLIMHIGKQSLKENENGSQVQDFPTSVSAVKHEEWKMRGILAYIGLMTDTQQGHLAVGKAMTEFHYEMRYWDEDELNETKSEAYCKVRSDGVTFKEKAKYALFLKSPSQWI